MQPNSNTQRFPEGNSKTPHVALSPSTSLVRGDNTDNIAVDPHRIAPGSQSKSYHAREVRYDANSLQVQRSSHPRPIGLHAASQFHTPANNSRNDLIQSGSGVLTTPLAGAMMIIGPRTRYEAFAHEHNEQLLQRLREADLRRDARRAIEARGE